MRCSECGKINDDSFKFCSECGSPLNGGNKGASTDTGEYDFFDDSDVKRYNDPDDEYDYEESDDDQDEYENSGTPRSQSGERIAEGGKINTGLFVASLLSLIILSVLMLYLHIKLDYDGKIDFFISSVFGHETITREPTIEDAITENGDPALKITIYARKNSKVIFEYHGIRSEETIINSSVSFIVPQAVFKQNVDVTGNVINVVPTVYVIDTDRNNEVVQAQFTPYRLRVDTVEITLTKPSSSGIVSANRTIDIEGYVADPSAQVYMNDELLQTDASGSFRTKYYAEQAGKNEVMFVAKINGYIVGSKKLIVDYSDREIPIEITNESFRTYTDTLEITGKVNSGATVEVQGVEIDGDVKVNADGTFSFIAKLPYIRNYVITINVTDNDITVSKQIYTEHAPDRDEFISSATSLDYKWLSSHRTMERKICIKGEIVEIIQTEPFIKGRIKTSQGDVIFTYYDTTPIEAGTGETYRLYVLPDGSDPDTDLPQVYCWFVRK